MSLKIAIGGKGGVGKTTVSALLARCFAADSNNNVIAIDADPVSNLAAGLGIDERVARFDQDDIDRLLKDEGIVRHRGKIEAVINNARKALDLVQEQGSLAAYLWRYEPDPKQLAEPQSVSTSPESIALSKDLKKRGWKFVGPTTVYSFMQSAGIVNDHLEGCVVRPAAASAQRDRR